MGTSFAGRGAVSRHATLGWTPSGIPGFDALTGGGLPRGQTTLVVGGPGTGKTLFALQALAEGARHANETSIFVAFEERAETVQRNVASFPWAPRGREKHLYFLDAQPPEGSIQAGDFDLLGLLAALDARVRRSNVRRIAFDGIDVLLGLLGEARAIRRELHRLHRWLADQRITGILTAKADRDTGQMDPAWAVLPFMGDSIVHLQHRLHDRIAIRSLQVSKCRGAAHNANEVPLLTGPGGLEVLGTSRGELVHQVSTERISSGVARLDTMIEGGYFRGTCTLITGAPGSAKTTLAGAFAAAACRRGEPTLIVSFDESAKQIVRNLASVRLSLRPWVRSGLLRMHSVRVRDLGGEAHLLHIRRLVERHGVRNLVVDPISALMHAGGAERAQDVIMHLIDMAKTRGVTLVATSLIDDPQKQEATDVGISTIADTWIHLSYLVNKGERNRALTIVKSRGTGHSNQVRELKLSRAGPDLADAYTASGEVLMGTLRWEKEEQERRDALRAKREAKDRRRRAELAVLESRARLDAVRKEMEAHEVDLARLGVEDDADREAVASRLNEHRRRRQSDRRDQPKRRG